MAKLPAAAAIFTVAAVAAAAPAAQGRRVLVAVERDAHSPAGGVLSGALPDGSPTYLVRVPRRLGSASFARRLSRTPGVIAAQANRRMHTAQQGPAGCVDPPDEPIRSIATSTNAALASVDGVTKPIAILDTGVDPGVPELAGRVLPDHDVVGGFSHPDEDGHGTEVASVAAASPGLIQGVSPTSQVFSVRIFNATGDSSSDVLVKAITAAVQNGAGVINISATLPLTEATDQDNSVITVAIAQAFDSGVLVVAPSGNEGKLQPDAPGAYPHVLTVGSGTSSVGRDLFSNTGPWLDLLAPGSDIVLPVPTLICTSGYAQVQGTSFAAPAVAGAVAMAQTAKPGIRPQQLFGLVRHAGTDVGLSGWDADSGFGFLDVSAAVTGPTPPAVGTEVDDDILFAKAKPYTALKLRKPKLINDSESAAKDNTDVVKIKLKKGELISANITTKTPNALFSVSLYDGRTGPLDLTNDVTKHLVKDSGGLSPTPFINKRVKKGGTYYVVVETPDTLQDDVDDTTPPDQAYTLKLKRQLPLKKHKKKRKK